MESQLSARNQKELKAGLEETIQEYLDQQDDLLHLQLNENGDLSDESDELVERLATVAAKAALEAIVREYRRPVSTK